MYSILYKWFYILHTFCILHPCCVCSYSCRSSKFLCALLSAQCHFFPLLCTSFSVCCLLPYHCSPFHKFPTFSTSIFSVITLVFFICLPSIFSPFSHILYFSLTYSVSWPSLTLVDHLFLLIYLFKCPSATSPSPMLHRSSSYFSYLCCLPTVPHFSLGKSWLLLQRNKQKAFETIRNTMRGKINIYTESTVASYLVYQSTFKCEWDKGQRPLCCDASWEKKWQYDDGIIIAWRIVPFLSLPSTSLSSGLTSLAFSCFHDHYLMPSVLQQSTKT